MAKNQSLIRMLDEIRFRDKLNQQQVAERIHVSSQHLSDVKNGRFPLSDDLCNRLYEEFTYLRIGGNSQPPDDKPVPDIQLMQSNAVQSQDVTDVEYAGENHNAGVFFRDKNTGQLYISVPHVPYAARGEFPNLADSLEPLSEWGREVYAVDKKANGRYMSFDVRGDSMDNGMRKSLQDGDKVLVRELEPDNWRTLRTGDHRFWVLVFGSSVLIKEISSFDTATGVVTCHSLNPSPEYHDFEVPLDTVRHLYYVIKIKPAEIEGI